MYLSTRSANPSFEACCQAARARNRDRMRPKSIFFNAHRRIILPMPVRTRHIATVLALALACMLAGCASINEKLANGMGDYIPQWAGGLPRDAPPRRGTPQYEAYMKEQERKRLEPAANANAAAPASASPAPSLDPVH